MRVLVAFDKFKDSLTAPEACETVASILEEACPGVTVTTCPLTDGGEGFRPILTQQADGKEKYVRIHNSLLRNTTATIGIVQAANLPPKARDILNLPNAKKIAIIEMAEGAGLQQLSPQERDCRQTTTLGVGEMLLYAAEMEVDGILLGIGGSSTSDLGLGALEAIGMRYYDHNNDPIIGITPRQWENVVKIDWDNSVRLPPIRIACDVSNPLLGENGAAAVYGPQKGLPRDQVEHHDHQAKGLIQLLQKAPGLHVAADLHQRAGMGAAGGIAYGLAAALGENNVQLVQGYDLVKEWLQLEEHLANADIILTGEGKFDQSSLQGKGPGELVRKASAAEKKAIVLAGRIEVTESDLPKGVTLIEISDRNESLAEELKRGKNRLATGIYENAHKICK